MFRIGVLSKTPIRCDAIRVPPVSKHPDTAPCASRPCFARSCRSRADASGADRPRVKNANELSFANAGNKTPPGGEPEGVRVPREIGVTDLREWKISRWSARIPCSDQSLAQPCPGRGRRAAAQAGSRNGSRASWNVVSKNVIATWRRSRTLRAWFAGCKHVSDERKMLPLRASHWRRRQAALQPTAARFAAGRAARIVSLSTRASAAKPSPVGWISSYHDAACAIAGTDEKSAWLKRCG